MFKIISLEIFFTTTYLVNARLCPENSTFLSPNTCYWLTPTKKSAESGQVDCVKDGGSLAEIIDDEGFAFTQETYSSYLRQNAIDAVWVGILRKNSSHYTTWSGEVIESLPWSNQESSFNNDGACVVITSSWQWNGTDCRSCLQGLCVKVLDICPSGSLYNIDNSTCYWITSEEKNTFENQNDCERENGSLAVFHDADEFNFLLDNYMTQLNDVIDNGWPYTYIWIGGNDTAHEDTFETADGYTLTYFNWGDNQPDHYYLGRKADCITLGLFNQYHWWDTYCYYTLQGLCYRTKGMMTVSDEMVMLSTEVSIECITTSTESIEAETLSTEISTTTDQTESENLPLLNTSVISGTIQTLANSDRFEITSSSSPPTKSTTDQPPDCFCKCDKIMSISISSDELQSSIQQIVQELKVDRKNTFTAKASLICAKDDRPSASATGIFGILILCFVGGLFAIPDALAVLRLLRIILRR